MCRRPDTVVQILTPTSESTFLIVLLLHEPTDNNYSILIKRYYLCGGSSPAWYPFAVFGCEVGGNGFIWYYCCLSYSNHLLVPHPGFICVHYRQFYCFFEINLVLGDLWHCLLVRFGSMYVRLRCWVVYSGGMGFFYADLFR